MNILLSFRISYPYFITDPYFRKRSNDERGVWTSGDLTSKTKATGHSYVIVSPSGKEFYPPEGRQWAPSYETYLKLKQENRLWFGEKGDNVPRQKQFLSEIQAGVVPTTLMPYAECGHNQEAKKELISLLPGIGNAFETPKPSRLLRKLLGLVNFDFNDIILDFFSGSATTAHAVMQLNAEDGGSRRFIMVQLPEVCSEKSEAYNAGYKNICEIGKERIRRAGKKILSADDGQVSLDKDKPPLDVGFKVFKLDTSNMKLWDDTPIEDGNVITLFDRIDGHIDGLKPDRGNEDLLYEVLLKMGYPLTADVAALDVEGLAVSSIAGGEMLICLQEGVTADHIEKMAALSPLKIVLAGRCLADSSAKANAFYLLKNREITLEVF